MCGIVYARSLVGKPVEKAVIMQYKAQRNRGSEGFGFYVPQKDRLTHNTREGRILNLLRRSDAEEILFHHRYPTSTSNRRNAAHPFSTKDYFDNQYIVVHNGVLSNEDALRKEHEALGIKYVSEQSDGSYNDSEALAYDLARYLEGQVDKISAKGTIAFIAIKRDKDGNAVSLHFGRNTGNPLKMNETDEILTLSSEGDGELVPSDRIYTLDYATGKMTYEEVEIPDNWGYGGYSSQGYTYRGYSTGYSRDYDDDRDFDMYDLDYDRDGNPMPIARRTQEQTFLSEAADRILAGRAHKTQAQHVMDAKNALLTEASGDAYFAIDLGEDMLKSKEAREIELETIVELEEKYTTSEWEEYQYIREEMWYISQALDALRKEVVAAVQLGFRRKPLPELPSGDTQ